MSNRLTKLELHKRNPRCHWCKKTTILTNESNIKGHPIPLMATLDHLISRYNFARWRRKRPHERRKVLACYECNHSRSVKETLCLSRAEVIRRSKGFSLSPRGRPKIITPLPTLREVKQRLTNL